ncbi:MAG: helix-turn-helix domain-containing protein [Phenylobacterium sp.]|uniref:helix-turn-helix domain-containing protein n=1 Tax=Phenylobacterium sp. TaxID=1871053 RepID=UPI001A3B5B8B|nr:helix-turn-helix domain-containing protein [Phenylobacterium sp.]MBL8773278.1 helix-turn-helix domain-containing protein [Phenylobacterium sp.]
MLRKRPAKKLSDRQRARAALAVAERERSAPEGPEADAPAPVPLDPLLAHETIGEALRAARLDRGLALADLAETTRVRKAYLEAIEEMRLDALPSRPFTIGYIRAYATALGLDPDLATERFKSDEPVLDEPLRAPVGVLDDKDPRVAAFLVGAVIIIAAIVLWNVAQRAMMAAAPPPALASEAETEKALAQVKAGPMALGAPLPAPVESTTPTPYETPGLRKSLGLEPAADAAQASAEETPTVDLSLLPKVFTPQGRIYDMGNPAIPSVVTLQALKGGSLIIRGADGSVYFARQLAKGEAFRVPQLSGITLDVSNPQDVQVFVYGRSTGVLPSAQVLASKLVVAPPATAGAAAPAVAAPPAIAAPPPRAPAPATPAAKTPPAKAPAPKTP